MNHILMTWNPGAGDDDTWDRTGFEDALVVPFLAGKITRTTWTVGRNRNNIEPGDTAFLYRQGVWGRGIVARGVIRCDPYVGEHWARDSETANYVDIDWEEAVPVELALDVDALEKAVPDFAWRQVYGSGRRVPDGDGDKLEKAWRRYIRRPMVRGKSEIFVSQKFRDSLLA